MRESFLPWEESRDERVQLDQSEILVVFDDGHIHHDEVGKI